LSGESVLSLTKDVFLERIPKVYPLYADVGDKPGQSIVIAGIVYLLV
jgi:hypothetical protein